MSWHADRKIHISWGPDGEKLSPEDKEREAATLLADAQARREQHDKADKALEGLPFVAVPVEQLTDIYERMLRLVMLGQTSISDLTALPEEVRQLRHKVFEQADFGAVFAGQWLPPHVRKATRDLVKGGGDQQGPPPDAAYSDRAGNIRRQGDGGIDDPSR